MLGYKMLATTCRICDTIELQDKQDKISQNGNSMKNLLNAASHPGSRHNSTERIPSSMYGRTND